VWQLLILLKKQGSLRSTRAPSQLPARGALLGTGCAVPHWVLKLKLGCFYTALILF